MMAAAAVGVVSSLLTAALAVLVGYSLRPPFELPVGWAVALVAALGIVVALGPAARSQAGSAVRQRAQQLIYRHLLTVGPAVRDEHRTGDLAGVITDGVERVAAMVGRFFPLAVRAGVVPIALAAVAMVIDLWAGLAMLIAFPAVPAAIRHLERSFRGAGERLRASRDALAAEFLDALQGLTTLKLLNRGANWSERLAYRSEGVRRDTMAVLRVNQRALIWVDLVYSAVSVLLLVVVVWWRLSIGAIDLADSVVLFLLAVVAIEPLVDVVSFFYLAALGMGALRRIQEISQIPSLIQGRSHSSTPPKGELVLENATFTYESASRPALDGVDLVVMEGTSLALIGRSGAGKSTLASLCLGLRHPQRGRVLIDGTEVAGADRGWLSQRIAYVGQATHLFSATVADNLRVARPDASREQLLEACSNANLLGTVQRLPDGLDSLIGERGSGLSAGEAQRLGIARALLADTPILILDEATSNLDMETEALVSEALERLRERRTVIVIAHRITTARRCDRVVHLKAGRVVADARPGELEEDLFRRMQMGGR